jgi:hypothetical protein
MAKHLTSQRKLRPHNEQSFSANRETRPPSELPASSKSARSLLRRVRRRRSPWRCRASTTPFWPVVRVEFLGFQREILEGNIDAEIENLEAARREHGSCGLHRFACEDQVGKKHFALPELLADGVQSQNKAAINGFEWVDVLGEGALAECSGAIGIALKDGLLHRFGKLIGDDDLASRAFWPSGIARF